MMCLIWGTHTHIYIYIYIYINLLKTNFKRMIAMKK